MMSAGSLALLFIVLTFWTMVANISSIKAAGFYNAGTLKLAGDSLPVGTDDGI